MFRIENKTGKMLTVVVHRDSIEIASDNGKMANCDEDHEDSSHRSVRYRTVLPSIPTSLPYPPTVRYTFTDGVKGLN